MIRSILITVACLLPVLAAATPKDDAIRAASDLRAALARLEDAEARRDRVDALTETIGAIEIGMANVRENLRRASIQEQTVQGQLAARETEIAQLLGNLHVISTAREPTFLLHPMGPTGTARAGMILAEITPALQSRVSELEGQLEVLSSIQSVQQDAEQILASALIQVKTARFDLSQAISNRTNLPLRFVEDPTNTAILLATTQTLDDFAKDVHQIATQEVVVQLPQAKGLIGTLDLPVLGQILRNFEEADAAGIKRPGIVIATDPGALVTTPATATVRYQGPLLDYGQVAILEPAQDVLMIFGGMAQVLVQTGEVVIKGAPLGLMPGAQDTGNPGQDTLYIEIRETQTPVDPMIWFAAQ